MTIDKTKAIAVVLRDGAPLLGDMVSDTGAHKLSPGVRFGVCPSGHQWNGFTVAYGLFLITNPTQATAELLRVYDDIATASDVAAGLNAWIDVEQKPPD